MTDTTASLDRRDLLAWYDRHRRRLPWRAPPGTQSDPYHVWLSEIMLQQTTVAAVDAYFRAFTDRWPGIADLAAAPLDAVLTAWAGLGYYARARNLHRCAGMVAQDLDGRFPTTPDALQTLPGVGTYTAAAIAAIAFDHPVVPADGNVERVCARLFAIETPLPAAKPALRQAAQRFADPYRPGDFAQAMMDLGATVCTPRQPRCVLCPWQSGCLARRYGRQADLPAKAGKAPKPIRRGTAFWLTDADGAVWLRQRPHKGLLGGMIEVPSSPWQPDAVGQADAAVPPVAADWRLLPGSVRHTFTHFDLELTVQVARIRNADAIPDGFWAGIDRLGDLALPTVMRKIVRHAMVHAGEPAPAGSGRQPLAR